VSLDISIALRAEQDLTLQYRWYIENAGHEIAESYLTAVHETILKIAEWPDMGLTCPPKSGRDKSGVLLKEKGAEQNEKKSI